MSNQETNQWLRNQPKEPNDVTLYIIYNDYMSDANKDKEANNLWIQSCGYSENCVFLISFASQMIAPLSQKP